MKKFYLNGKEVNIIKNIKGYYIDKPFSLINKNCDISSIQDGNYDLVEMKEIIDKKGDKIKIYNVIEHNCNLKCGDYCYCGNSIPHKETIEKISNEKECGEICKCEDCGEIIYEVKNKHIFIEVEKNIIECKYCGLKKYFNNKFFKKIILENFSMLELYSSSDIEQFINYIIKKRKNIIFWYNFKVDERALNGIRYYDLYSDIEGFTIYWNKLDRYNQFISIRKKEMNINKEVIKDEIFNFIKIIDIYLKNKEKYRYMLKEIINLKNMIEELKERINVMLGPDSSAAKELENYFYRSYLKLGSQRKYDMTTEKRESYSYYKGYNVTTRDIVTRIYNRFDDSAICGGWSVESFILEFDDYDYDPELTKIVLQYRETYKERKEELKYLENKYEKLINEYNSIEDIKYIQDFKLKNKDLEKYTNYFVHPDEVVIILIARFPNIAVEMLNKYKEEIK